MSDETFDVTIRVAVDGAEGGWNMQPIFAAIRSNWFEAPEGVTGRGILSVDVKRVDPPTPTVEPPAISLEPDSDWMDTITSSGRAPEPRRYRIRAHITRWVRGKPGQA